MQHQQTPGHVSTERVLIQKARAKPNGRLLETAPMSLKPSNLALSILDHCQPKPY